MQHNLTPKKRETDRKTILAGTSQVENMAPIGEFLIPEWHATAQVYREADV
jgi:hypothetical protein